VEDLEIEHQKALTACQGYMELGMPGEALKELQTLPVELAERPAVLEMQVVILIRAKRWRAALQASRKLCRLHPLLAAGFIHAAFCQHELGKTEAARKTLLTGPRSLEKEGTYFYNLACYDAVLGDLEAARRHLARSIRLDKRFREFARNDRDLAALHEELK
jgi:predicted Zn-dependent protease